MLEARFLGDLLRIKGKTPRDAVTHRPGRYATRHGTPHRETQQDPLQGDSLLRNPFVTACMRAALYPSCSLLPLPPATVIGQTGTARPQRRTPGPRPQALTKGNNPTTLQ